MGRKRRGDRRIRLRCRSAGREQDEGNGKKRKPEETEDHAQNLGARAEAGNHFPAWRAAGVSRRVRRSFPDRAVPFRRPARPERTAFSLFFGAPRVLSGA